MPKQKITDRTLRSYATGSKRAAKPQVEIYDTANKSFGIVVNRNREGEAQRVSFFFRYRSPNELTPSGRPRHRRLILGTYPEMGLADALRDLHIARGRVAAGEDPAAAREQVRQQETFRELCELYLATHARHLRTRNEQARVIHKDLLPHWGGFKVSEITRRHVIQLLDGIDARGAPVMARRVFALTRKIFNFAISRDMIDSSPCFRVQPPGHESQRKVWLSTPGDVKKFWFACSEAHPVMSAALRFLLLTGQRVGEVRQMAKADLVAPDLWVIPAAVSKNKRDHLVYLAPEARSLLMYDGSSSADHFFPSPRSPHGPLSPTSFNQAVKRVRLGIGMPELQARDLRTTFATWLRRLRCSAETVSRCLNHTSATVTERHYTDLFDFIDDKAEAMGLWESFVRDCVLGEVSSERVVPVRPRQAVYRR